ncbi:DMT family transporter [Prosthecomicrobium pneumaticum]|uniref:Drug/metabolite transporter (DMT)-like permease n=1 Tax=Prosthecomicrobium pneumaticum TaxID=81895 RepID=A0A7W9L3N4_9HYPH|nr:DMT family transporter [Prosthecomicrobium pneumaticum]MBB5754730.1 drug/metabolite transporter (DMT)-like permease [Prosthecomicrobium pneumaticum]
MSRSSDNLRGIAMMMLCNLLFLVNDALIKLVSATLPTGQIIVMRGSIALVVIAGVVVATGAHRQIGLLFDRLVAWRTLGEIGATLLYLVALFKMPLANVTAINQVVPLMTTAAAALFLGEAVGWRRWTAIGIGFVGVMVIIRPGAAGFDAYALLALASMLFITVRDLVTRGLSPAVPTVLVVAAASVGVLLSGATLAVAEDWVVPGPHELALLFVASLLLLGGYATVIIAMRVGEMAVVAPFRYVVILYAIVVGYLVFGDVPDLPTLAGSAIVVATGIYTVHRERRRARSG